MNTRQDEEEGLVSRTSLPEGVGGVHCDVCVLGTGENTSPYPIKHDTMIFHLPLSLLFLKRISNITHLSMLESEPPEQYSIKIEKEFGDIAMPRYPTT